MRCLLPCLPARSESVCDHGMSWLDRGGTDTSPEPARSSTHWRAKGWIRPSQPLLPSKGQLRLDVHSSPPLRGGLCSSGSEAAADRTPPQRPPRELLFEFYANKRFFRAELLDRGKWGVEAQIIEAPDDLRIGHRFDHRGQAVRWAEAMRRDMEAWRCEP
jgi:hypothetical protein